MKKLVLIPHDRYQQLIKRECKGEENKEQTELGVKQTDKEVESVPEIDITEEVKPDVGVVKSAQNIIQPPPPGEPVNVDQLGEGENLNKSKTQKRKNKASFWRLRWKPY